MTNNIQILDNLDDHHKVWMFVMSEHIVVEGKILDYKITADGVPITLLIAVENEYVPGYTTRTEVPWTSIQKIIFQGEY